MKCRQLTSQSSSPFLRRSIWSEVFWELKPGWIVSAVSILHLSHHKNYWGVENFFVTFLKHKKEIFYHVQDKKHYHFNGVFMVSRRFDHFQIFFIELCQTAWKQSSYKLLLINDGVGFWNCSAIATRALLLIKRNF